MAGPERRGPGAAIAVILVVSLLAVGALGIAVFALLGSGADDDGADEVVAVTVPLVTVPGVTVPLQTVPPVTVPAVTVPPVTEPAITAPPPVDLFSGTQAQAVVAEVAAARGADPLRILRAAFYPTYAFFQVQDPSVPEYVDEYPWRGTVGEPSPVRLNGVDDLEVNLFSDDEADWTVIPALVAAAPALTEIADGEVSHVIVERPLPFSSDVRMRIFVSSPRTSGYVDADAAGNVIAVTTG
jgi:hypothetical protein